jgi:hypothetical protein
MLDFFELRAEHRLHPVKRLWLSERAGSQTLCDATSASGLRHESDGVITCADMILHVETKHLTESVFKNDLMVFNQKGLDFALSGDPRRGLGRSIACS